MSVLIHSGVALLSFLLIAPLLGANAAMAAPIAAYWAREGAEAQWASRLPKAETWWYPWAPWVWPRQMVLDAGLPALTALGLRIAYEVVM